MDLETIGLRESRVSASSLELFRLMIDSVLQTGRVQKVAARAQLIELAAHDWLAANADGTVNVVYPFALEPSDIAVTLQDVERYAVCAIDALGIAPMLDTDVVVRAVCPQSGANLRIEVDKRDLPVSEPEGVVVLRRRQRGAAHSNRCAATRFFLSADEAARWRSSNGDEADVILTLQDAYKEATAIFGRCYSDGVRMVL